MTQLTNTDARAFSRRQFLSGLTGAAKTSLIVLSVPAILSACSRSESVDSSTSVSGYKILTDDLAKTLDAISARIVPTDSTPGAREANTVGFIDHVLLDGRQDLLPAIKQGIDELNTAARERFAASGFAELSEAQQDQLLTDVETTPFFGTLRYLTVASLFAFPQYGGNGPDVGYTLVGMTHAHAYAPPFGYYDADYAARGE